MTIFYLLKNGEIKTVDGSASSLVNIDAIPIEIDGVKVLAAANSVKGINDVRNALFPDEESLIGKLNVENLTPIDAAYLAERGYGFSMN